MGKSKQMEVSRGSFPTIIEINGGLWSQHVAMGQNLWYHIWVDEHPFTSYFDVHQGYRVLTHNHVTISLTVHVYSTHMQKIERMPWPPRARLTGRLHEGEWIHIGCNQSITYLDIKMKESFHDSYYVNHFFGC